MIVRQLCLRQSRNAAFVIQTPRRLARFSSIDTPTTTTTTATTLEPLVQDELRDPIENIASNEATSLESSETAGSHHKNFWKGVKQYQKLKNIGTTISGAYKPESLLKNPPKASDITLEMLLAAQSHLGHTTSRWNPQNTRYIFGVREGIHIISLDVTAAHLRRAAKVVQEVARRGGIILFVGTRDGQKRSVVRAAELAKGYHVFERWIPGSLTNSQQILGECAVKVVNAVDEELPHYTKRIALPRALKPDLVVCFNPVENDVLLHECGLNNIPTIGIIDTDADPTRVTYPIPANDDSISCLEVIAGVLGKAGEEGQRQRLNDAARGVLTYEPLKEEQYFKQAEPDA
ncbi:putative 40S ribosomal protein S2 [Talaromyces proteolyticus]|uniref:40S ribosomal protein S2 n=1 Tax=Talaromyces proteolyticus TaxID=1131652 RepID=A0AAD4KQJ1_9EURO|nr:putative 40S ribosomal protein S2 [Talaromyces proteolyticus]KAH8697106.1 putative 40S ribosomal protein S2 [Talaromyces proteolyticus]